MGMDVRTGSQTPLFWPFFGHSWKRGVGILNEAFFDVTGLGRPVKSVSELGTLFIGEKAKLYGTW